MNSLSSQCLKTSYPSEEGREKRVEGKERRRGGGKGKGKEVV
jgi:hypothetical protein